MISLSFSLFLFCTHCTVCICSLAVFQICADIHPNKFLHHWTQHTQTTNILHVHSADSRRQLCSLLLQCNNKSDFTLVSYSLTAFSSLRLPVVFPFEADSISHIHTSIFLKGGWVRLLWSLSHEKTQTCTTSHPEETSHFSSQLPLNLCLVDMGTLYLIYIV